MSGPRARARLRIEDIDPHMAVDLQRPGGGQHEQRGMGIEHRFLQADRADAERIAHHHHGEFGQHDVETAPRRRAADGRNGAVDDCRQCVRTVFLMALPGVL